MIQRTDEWFQERIGKVTASRISDATAKTKNGEAATRTNYRLELVTERLTGKKAEGFTNSYIQWGIEQEPYAREAYEKAKNEFVIETGFILHPSINMSGASPDGLVAEDGLIEIKCPASSTMLSYVSSGNIPEKYRKQMAWQIICTGRKWCDFVSYDPRLPEGLQLWVKRYEPTNEELSQLESEVIEFLKSVDELQQQIESMKD